MPRKTIAGLEQEIATLKGTVAKLEGRIERANDAIACAKTVTENAGWAREAFKTAEERLEKECAFYRGLLEKFSDMKVGNQS